MNLSEESCITSRSFDQVQITRLLLNLVHFNGTKSEYLRLLSGKLTEAGVPVFSINLFTDEPGGLNYSSSISAVPDNSTGTFIPFEDMTSPLKEALELFRTGKIITGPEEKNTPFPMEWDHRQYHEYYGSLPDSHERSVLLETPGSGYPVILPLIKEKSFYGTMEMLIPEKDTLPSSYPEDICLAAKLTAESCGMLLDPVIEKNYGGKSEAAFESAPDPAFIISPEGTIIEANRAFRNLAGLSASHARGRSCREVCSPLFQEEMCGACPLGDTFKTGGRAIREVTLAEDEPAAIYRITSTPVYNTEGTITAITETLINITDRVEEDKEIKQLNLKLEGELTRKIQILKDKERHLHTLVSTVHNIESGNKWPERLHHIIAGFMSLDACSVSLVIRNNDSLQIARIFPGKINEAMSRLLDSEIESSSFDIENHRENPFAVSVEMIQPIFFIGDEGIHDFFESCYPNTEAAVRDECAALLQGQSIIIFPLEAKDGAEGAIAVSASLEILESNFEYFQLLSSTVAVEIDRRKNAAVLAESEKRYRSLIESSKEMIVFCSREGKIRFSNRTFYNTTGHTKKDTVGTSLYDFLPAMEKEKVKRLVSTVIENASIADPGEIILKGSKGKDIWTEMTITRAADNGDNLHIAFRDISFRKNLETQLSDISTVQDQIIQTDMIGIVTTDLGGMITRWNSGAQAILGYGEIEVLGKNIREFIGPAHTIIDPVPFAGSGMSGPRHAREVTLNKRNNTTVAAMYAEQVMSDSAGRPILNVSFFFDITEKINLEAHSKELMRQLSQAQQVTILSLAKLTEYRDLETGTHLERIMKYTEILAHELSELDSYNSYITEEYILDLVSSCPLHDIGKVGIPDNILHKPGKLTNDEFDIMKNHTIIGGDTIRDAEEQLQSRSYLELGREIAYSHHEKWDGSGYPHGLKKEKIPLSARIVSVADVYDALISKRPYKDAYTHQTAASIIKKNGGTHFDPAIINAFTRCEPLFKEYSELAFQETSREGLYSRDIDDTELN